MGANSIVSHHKKGRGLADWLQLDFGAPFEDFSDVNGIFGSFNGSKRFLMVFNTFTTKKSPGSWIFKSLRWVGLVGYLKFE